MHKDQPARTIKQTRSELRKWGRFWQRYGTEVSSGGSLFAAMMQRFQKSDSKYHRRRRVKKDDIRSNMPEGTVRPVSADCSPSRTSVAYYEREVFVPWSLQGLDDFIESMQPECSDALRRRYVEEEDVRGVWLDRAEKLVMFR